MEPSYLCADILKALAQPIRLKIVELLADGEHCVCEIFPAIAQEQSNTSRHLQMMLKSGILSQRKEGLKIYYSLRHPEVLEIVHLAETMVDHETMRRSALVKAKRSLPLSR